MKKLLILALALLAGHASFAQEGEQEIEEKVKKLIEQLHSERKLDAVKSAVEELAKIGKPAVEPLIEALGHTDYGIRSYAADILGTIGDKRAVQFLLKALKDRDESVRYSAADALGKLRDEKAVEPLIKALQDEYPAVRKAALLALIATGKPAIKPLAAALKHEEEEVRISAAIALGEIKDKSALDPLIETGLKNESWWVRYCAAEALLAIGDKKAIDPLIETLKDKVWQVRHCVAEVLGDMGDKKAVEALRKLWEEDKNTLVRLNAAYALGAIAADAQAIEYLVKSLEEEDKTILRCSCKALKKLGRLAVKSLKKAMKHENKFVRQLSEAVLSDIAVLTANNFLDSDKKGRAKAEQTLIEIGPLAVRSLLLIHSGSGYASVVAIRKIGDKAIEPLLKLFTVEKEELVLSEAAWVLANLDGGKAEKPLRELWEKDKRKRVRFGAAKGLAIVAKDPEAIKFLIGAVKDKELYFAGYAAEMFKAIGSAAVEPLIKALKETDPATISVAAAALGMIGDKRAIKPLIMLLKNKNPDLCFSVAMALVRFRKEAVEPLVKAFREQGPEVRRYAALALGNIGQGASEHMMAMLKDKDASIRSHAIGVLGMLREKKAYDSFIAALGDEDAEVRMSAAWALRKLADKRAFEPLASLLKDKDERVRVSAGLALAKMGDRRAVEPLIEALKSEKKIGVRPIKEEAAHALQALTKQDFGTDYEKWKEWYEKGRGK